MFIYQLRHDRNGVHPEPSVPAFIPHTGVPCHESWPPNPRGCGTHPCSNDTTGGNRRKSQKGLEGHQQTLSQRGDCQEKGEGHGRLHVRQKAVSLATKNPSIFLSRSLPHVPLIGERMMMRMTTTKARRRNGRTAAMTTEVPASRSLAETRCSRWEQRRPSKISSSCYRMGSRSSPQRNSWSRSS